MIAPKPRDPPAAGAREVRAEARAVRNPLPANAANLDRGRAIYLGNGFCATCHGRDGRGLGPHVDTAGLHAALPRDFTDRVWQRSRRYGERFWVLQQASADTPMAPFVPGVL